MTWVESVQCLSTVLMLLLLLYVPRAHIQIQDRINTCACHESIYIKLQRHTTVIDDSSPPPSQADLIPSGLLQWLRTVPLPAIWPCRSIRCGRIKTRRVADILWLCNCVLEVVVILKLGIKQLHIPRFHSVTPTTWVWSESFTWLPLIISSHSVFFCANTVFDTSIWICASVPRNRRRDAESSSLSWERFVVWCGNLHVFHYGFIKHVEILNTLLQETHNFSSSSRLIINAGGSGRHI